MDLELIIAGTFGESQLPNNEPVLPLRVDVESENLDTPEPISSNPDPTVQAEKLEVAPETIKLASPFGWSSEEDNEQVKNPTSGEGPSAKNDGSTSDEFEYQQTKPTVSGWSSEE